MFDLFPNFLLFPIVGSVTFWKRKLSLINYLNLVSGLLVFSESVYQFCQSVGVIKISKQEKSALPH